MMVIIDDDNGDGWATSMMTTVLILFLHFKSAVRADWRCRGCVVIVIIMTVGDAEDAR